MKKNVYIFFLLSIFALAAHANEPPRGHLRPIKEKTLPLPQGDQAEWTILILVQASNNLESFAHTNMKEMMKWGSTHNMNILVDLHKTGDKSWRYKIERGCCVIEEVAARSNQSTIEQEVMSSATWAITKYPAKKYALVFWNHGLGCIDPQITPGRPGYLAGSDTSWRTPESMQEPLNPSRALRNIIPPDRSILFDDERQTYLSNQALRNVLKNISTTLLNGEKISLVGMDACNMGMLEIADQIKEYAEYFVASEEFELAQGWPYGEIIEKLIQTPTMSSKDLGSIIVQAYARYYTNKTSYYTQSCVDLSKIVALKENIDLCARTLLAAKKEDPDRIRLFIQQARSQALSFSISDYLDIQSFYQELLKLTTIGLDTQKTKQAPIARLSNETYTKLKTILNQGLLLLKEAVVENVAGRYLARAGGMAIYFPQRTVDRSYLETEMTKTTAWTSFIIAQVLPAKN